MSWAPGESAGRAGSEVRRDPENDAGHIPAGRHRTKTRCARAPSNRASSAVDASPGWNELPTGRPTTNTMAMRWQCLCDSTSGLSACLSVEERKSVCIECWVDVRPSAMERVGGKPHKAHRRGKGRHAGSSQQGPASRRRCTCDLTEQKRTQECRLRHGTDQDNHSFGKRPSGGISPVCKGWCEVAFCSGGREGVRCEVRERAGRRSGSVRDGRAARAGTKASSGSCSQQTPVWFRYYQNGQAPSPWASTATLLPQARYPEPPHQVPERGAPGPDGDMGTVL
jgi:hypothetical protein